MRVGGKFQMPGGVTATLVRMSPAAQALEDKTSRSLVRSFIKLGRQKFAEAHPQKTREASVARLKASVLKVLERLEGGLGIETLELMASVRRRAEALSEWKVAELMSLNLAEINGRLGEGKLYDAVHFKGEDGLETYDVRQDLYNEARKHFGREVRYFGLAIRARDKALGETGPSAGGELSSLKASRGSNSARSVAELCGEDYETTRHEAQNRLQAARNDFPDCFR